MIQNIIRQVGGIDHFGIISLCLFATVFACVFVWACLQRKGHLDHMSRVPLEEEPDTGETSHE